MDTAIFTLMQVCKFHEVSTPFCIVYTQLHTVLFPKEKKLCIARLCNRRGVYMFDSPILITEVYSEPFPVSQALQKQIYVSPHIQPQLPCMLLISDLVSHLNN